MKSSTFEKADDIDPITTQKKYGLMMLDASQSEIVTKVGGANVDWRLYNKRKR